MSSVDLPIQYEDFSIECLGTIDPRPTYHDSLHIWPASQIFLNLMMYKVILDLTNRELNSNVSLRIRMITLIERRAFGVSYFALESKIDEKRREEQRLSQAANIQEAHGTSTLQNNATFHRMISERNRRVKLKQHFSFLHSLLPKNSKKDEYSILSNTTKCLSELKHQVDELEQRNCALEELLKANISNKEGCSSFDQKHEENLTTLIYSSDEVVLEQSKNIPNELHIRLNVQIDPLSSPTSLVIVLLERLRGLQLEVVSVESNIETFNFQAHLLIKQNEGDEWERSKWENLAEVVRLMFI